MAIGYTVAEGVAVGDPKNKGSWTLDVLRSNHGLAIDVPDQEVIAAQGDLARREGIYAGPTGSVALAGLRKLRKEGEIDSDASVVALVTEHGLKGDLPHPSIRPVPATYEDLYRHLSCLLSGA